MENSNYNGIILFSANYQYDSDTIDRKIEEMKQHLASSTVFNEINYKILFNKKKEIISKESNVINNLFLEDSNINTIYNLIAIKKIKREIQSKFTEINSSLLDPVIQYNSNTISNSIDYNEYFNKFKLEQLEVKKTAIKNNISEYISSLNKKINKGDITRIENKLSEFKQASFLIETRISAKYNEIISDNYDDFKKKFDEKILSIYNSYSLIYSLKTEILIAINNNNNINIDTYKLIYTNKETLKKIIISIIDEKVFKPIIKEYEQELQKISDKNAILKQIIHKFKYIYENSILLSKSNLDSDNIELIIDKFKENYKGYYTLLYNELIQIKYKNEIINEITEDLKTLLSQSDNEIDILFKDFFDKKEKILQEYTEKYNEYIKNKERFEQKVKENLQEPFISQKKTVLINDQIEKTKSEILRYNYTKKNINSETIDLISSLNSDLENIKIENKLNIEKKSTIEGKIFNVLQYLETSKNINYEKLNIFNNENVIKLILNLSNISINLNASIDELINLLINYLFENMIWEKINFIFNNDDSYKKYRFTLTQKKIDDNDNNDNNKNLKELVASIETLNEIINNQKSKIAQIEFTIPIFIYYIDGIVFNYYQNLTEPIQKITLKTLIDIYKY
jgi:hypothetical protein